MNPASITTVGLSVKYTTNRKFFANLLTTPEFMAMLAKDVAEIEQNQNKKMKYCEDVVMDEDILEEFYDKEVDPSKL
ncbi:DNA ligase [Operophtera brumata]|uniref:DNA ligase n=1 Tax=Operophtera brumata TaxID=104452 RepID=A0A0L7KN84_OPEBR|nr:DNA ligase [Operophtera brumata]